MWGLGYSNVFACWLRCENKALFIYGFRSKVSKGNNWLTCTPSFARLSCLLLWEFALFFQPKPCCLYILSNKLIKRRRVTIIYVIFFCLLWVKFSLCCIMIESKTWNEKVQDQMGGKPRVQPKLAKLESHPVCSFLKRSEWCVPWKIRSHDKVQLTKGAIGKP